MNFTTNRINNQSKHSININVTENYRSVSLYNDIPQEELTFDEFEMFALDRYIIIIIINNIYYLFKILKQLSNFYFL